MNMQKVVHYLLILFGIFSLISCEENKQALLSKNGISSTPVERENQTDTNRVIIKTADIHLKVDHLEDKIQAFQKLVNTLHGRVYHYEIKNEIVAESTTPCSFDSAYHLQEINPIGFLRIRIPVAQSDSFIANVLGMQTRIDHFLFDENDITETLAEKQDLANMFSSPPQKKSPQNTEKLARYKDEQIEKTIQRKKEFNSLSHQADYLWFDIHLQGEQYTDRQKTAYTAVYQTPVYIRAGIAMYKGWVYFADFMIALLYVWPFIIGLIVVWIFYKKGRMLRLRNNTFHK